VGSTIEPLRAERQPDRHAVTAESHGPASLAALRCSSALPASLSHRLNQISPMLVSTASLRRVIGRLAARTSRPPASCPRPIMFSPTRPIAIDTASRRRQLSYADYDYSVAIDAAPPMDAGDMMFDMDGTYDYSLAAANPMWHTSAHAPIAVTNDHLASPIADYLSSTKDSFFDPNTLLGHDLSGAMDDDLSWALAAGMPSSAPITIPEPKSAGLHQHQQQHQSFMSYNDYHSPLFQDANAFSPAFSPSSFSPESDFAALHSPTSPPTFTFHNELPQQQPHYGTPTEALSALTISPQDTTLPYAAPAPAPAWASHLWPAQHEQPSSPDTFQPRSFVPEEALTRRARAVSQSLLFHPSSAPSAATVRPPVLSRGYSTQSDSVGVNAGTVRRRSRSNSASGEGTADNTTPGTPDVRASSPGKGGISADKSVENGELRHNLISSEADWLCSASEEYAAPT
jgi:hypothetical protein